jgi:hypothetical protein
MDNVQMGSPQPVRSELQAKLQPTPVPAWVRDNIWIFYFLTLFNLIFLK